MHSSVPFLLARTYIVSSQIGCLLPCLRIKKKKRHAPLKQYVVGAPMEQMAIDIPGPLLETPRKNKFILVVSDYFTKWIESYPMPNQEASTVAEKLVSEFICHFGVPRQLHSDQGTNFESKVFAEVCKLLDIEKTRTTPLHPQSGGWLSGLLQ